MRAVNDFTWRRRGGVPIIKDGAIIGAIGVSGMSSNQDAQVAEAGLAAL